MILSQKTGWFTGLGGCIFKFESSASVDGFVPLVVMQPILVYGTELEQRNHK